MKFFNVSPFLYILSLLIILSSCSSEEEPINFLGEYKAISLTYTECDDPAEDDFVVGADVDNKFCTEEDGTIECFSLTVRILEGGRFEHVFIDQVTRGGFFTSKPDKNVGTYTVTDNNIELCPQDNEQCILMTMNEQRTALLWEIVGTTCKRTYTILKQ